MKLLIITQKVDNNDAIMGFFHNWIYKLSSKFSHIYVIANHVGIYDFPNNVTILSLGKEKSYGKLHRYINFYINVLKVIFKIDGIFVHMCPEYVLALYPLNLFFKKRIIMWYAHARVSSLGVWASKRVYRVLSPSPASFPFKGSLNKIVYTGHGIDVNLFSPDLNKNYNKNKFIILAVGRISYIKDYNTLIDAARILVEKYKWKDFEIQVAGEPVRFEDKEYWSMLKKKLHKYNLTSNVKWLGSVPNKNMPLVYRSADIFIRMQGAGGFGKNELEAFACGLNSVLATDIYNEVINKWKEDVYFESGDANKLAQNIYNISKWDETKKINFSRKMREYVVNNHNLDNLVDKIFNVFSNKIK